MSAVVRNSCYLGDKGDPRGTRGAGRHWRVLIVGARERHCALPTRSPIREQRRAPRRTADRSNQW